MQKFFLLDNILGERGFSIADLCRMTGLGRSTVDTIRKQGGGRRENLDKIAASLGLEYDELYRYAENSQNEESNVLNTFDNTELLEIAELYRDEGNEQMHRKFVSIANKVGKNVIEILEQADNLFKQQMFDDAAREYARAFLSFKPYHVERVLASLPNYFFICEMENDIQPIIQLFHLVKLEKYRNIEMLCRIAVFLARKHTDEKTILQCVDIIESILSA